MMCKKAVILAVLTTLNLAACATFSGVESSKNVAKLKTGMSESQTLSLLGMPDSIVSQGDQDRWIYEFKREDKKGHNLYVDFNHGELAKAGELSGREIAAAEENRVPGLCTRRVHKEVMQESLCIK